MKGSGETSMVSPAWGTHTPVSIGAEDPKLSMAVNHRTFFQQTCERYEIKYQLKYNEYGSVYPWNFSLIDLLI